MKGFFLLLVLISFISGLIAQEARLLSDPDVKNSLEEVITRGLHFLKNNQRKETIEGKFYEGEWPNYMCLQKGFFLLGKRKKIDDSNCFAVASIHNTLAKIYLENPSYNQILPMLDLAFPRIISFQNGERFNFWNLLPPNRDLRKGADLNNQPLIRRPTSYKLKSRYINNAANVTEDADDTALGYGAIALRKKIKGKNFIADSLLPANNNITHIFEQYRDTNRNNRHWYNYLNGNDHETGAYLTWLDEEYQFKKWNIIKVTGHNATFFLPFSECYPHPYKPYIPYGSNDLDGVVNANVLSALALWNHSKSSGMQSSVKYLEKKSYKRKYDRVGIYYPNRFHFAYAVSEAYSSGVIELENSLMPLQEYILEKQDKDGGWSSRRKINKKDRLQSTAYAINALLNMPDNMYSESNYLAVENGIQFLLKNMKETENGIFWDGGVFFSGGTVVRNALVWKSDAYTTSIIIHSLVKYRNLTQKKSYRSNTDKSIKLETVN